MVSRCSFFYFHTLDNSDDENFFHLSAICRCWRDVYSFDHILTGLFLLFLLSCRCFYIFCILWWLANISPILYVFYWLIPLLCRSFYVWCPICFVFLLLLPMLLVWHPRNHCQMQCHKVFPLYLFLGLLQFQALCFGI